MTQCPDPKPPFGYYCEDVNGVPVAQPTVADASGVPLIQAPLKYCGTGDPVCPDSSVSGCISDTDGNPTSYGPAPAAPAPGNVEGSSPMMSRVRANRTGEPVLPYSTAHHPDQLVDITQHGEEVPFDSATGTFDTNPPRVRLDRPGEPLLPTSGTNGPDQLLNITVGGVNVPVSGATFQLPAYPEAAVVHPHYVRCGTFNFAPMYDTGGPGGTPSVPPLSSQVFNPTFAGNVNNPDPNNPALLVVTGQSDALASVLTPVYDTEAAWAVELVCSFDGNVTWHKIHENGFAVATSPLRVAHVSKNDTAYHILPPSGSVTVNAGVRISHHSGVALGSLPGQLVLQIASFDWHLISANSVLAV